MSWADHLTGSVSPPAWTGPAHLHLKLSGGDAADEDAVQDLDPSAPPCRCCTKCLRLLPLTKYYFFVNRREKTGFMCECKECHKARDREAAQRRHREKKLRAGEFQQLREALR